MSPHVPENLLSAFVDGDVDERIAIHVAEHLDGCPACATRAAGLEPLAAAFAAVCDPVPPPSLVPDILARLDQPDRAPVAEIAIGAGLLVVAALLALGLDSPISVATELLVLANAARTLLHGVTLAIGSFQPALALVTAAALTGGVLTLHLGAGDPAARRLP